MTNNVGQVWPTRQPASNQPGCEVAFLLALAARRPDGGAAVARWVAVLLREWPERDVTEALCAAYLTALSGGRCRAGV